MQNKKYMYWAIGSVIWMLIILNMSFQDVKYGFQYHFFHSRVAVDYQNRRVAYDKAASEGEQNIRTMLKSATRYDELEYLSLAAKRRAWRSRTPKMARNTEPQETVRSDYQIYLDEMAELEATYGKATLKKFREQNNQTEQILNDEMRARLLVPKIREPRLAAVFFHMIALPLALLLALWMWGLDYRHLRFFRK